MPQVSIIVPVYNARNYIKETVQSVLAQTFQNWELILVNDHSTDDTLAIMEELAREDARIHVFTPAEKGGAARARNEGLKVAAGRFIAFLDADDIWLPGKLTAQMAFMRKEKAAFVYTSYEFGDENAKGTGKIVHTLPQLTYKKALSRTIIFTSTTLFDTEQIAKEKLQMPLVKSEDTALWWRILREGYIAHGMDEVTTIYRRPKNSLSSNKAEAVRRIWNLYRNCEKLSIPVSAFHLFGWAVRATLRRM